MKTITIENDGYTPQRRVVDGVTVDQYAPLPEVQTLLVGDLDMHFREIPELYLRGFVMKAASASEAMRILWQQGSEFVVVPPMLPDLNVGEFVELVQSRFSSTRVIRLGNNDGPSPAAIAGPLSPERDPIVKSLAEPTPEDLCTGWGGIVGYSEQMLKVFRMARLVAPRDTTVLIEGESGTGKDLLASAIHNASAREKQPFVVINCAAIPDALLEAELFGHTKGAFTGASNARLGRVQAAQGGTLFLDEIGDMPLSLQSKLLRLLEQGEVQRLGTAEVVKVDCRVIAATNVGLKKRVEASSFREDLYYRLAVVPITLPPLRERLKDLEPLCKHVLAKYSPSASLTADALEKLREHPWPGNIRELKNVLERASIFAVQVDRIHANDIYF